MKNLFRDKSVWIIVIMVCIVAASSLVLGLGLFGLPKVEYGNLYIPITNSSSQNVSVSSSTNDTVVDLDASSSDKVASSSTVKKTSSSVPSSGSKISSSLIYLQNIEKIFNLKYAISSKTITINNLRTGQSSYSGYGFSFKETATSTGSISISEKIRGYMSTGLGIDLVNSGNSSSGISSYSNGKLFCSIFESMIATSSIKNVEVRCVER